MKDILYRIDKGVKYVEVVRDGESNESYKEDIDIYFEGETLEEVVTDFLSYYKVDVERSEEVMDGEDGIIRLMRTEDEEGRELIEEAANEVNYVCVYEFSCVEVGIE